MDIAFFGSAGSPEEDSRDDEPLDLIAEAPEEQQFE